MASASASALASAVFACAVGNGDLRSAQLNYSADGKSKGVATVIFKKHGDAARAFAEYNNRTLDDKPMRIELVVNPDVASRRLKPAANAAAAAAAALTARVGGTGGVSKARTPAAGAAAPAANGTGRGRRGRGGRGGRTPKPAVTNADLDAEMDAYMGNATPSAPAAAIVTDLANALM
eukprot:jgi/Hompol1/2640/HPOL_000479-RA